MTINSPVILVKIPSLQMSLAVNTTVLQLGLPEQPTTLLLLSIFDIENEVRQFSDQKHSFIALLQVMLPI